MLSCDADVRDQLKRLTVTELSLKPAQNEQKQSNSKKPKLSLSCGWQGI
jgi:hypothetical protein